ncbi:MAG: transcription-repair coupling factor [Acidobacteriota bacterium]|nr:transcription-repair coupling factor [Acidobacteriota bacterium]
MIPRPMTIREPESVAAAGVLDEIEARLTGSAELQALLRCEGAFGGLPIAAAAWLLEISARAADRPLLVIVPRETEAREWMQAAIGLGRRDDAVWFPAPSLSPYQEVETPLSVRAQEVSAIHRVLCAARPTVVCTPRALFRRLPALDDFRRAVKTIHRQGEYRVEALAEYLVRQGYHHADLVTETGEFAVRGGVIDIFPPNEVEPIRLDLFGDTIESIRVFDPISQRSSRHLERVAILPMDLFGSGQAEIERLGAVLSERMSPDWGLEAERRLAGLVAGEAFAGWDQLLPLLEDEPGSLTDLLPGFLTVAYDVPTLKAEVEHFAELLEDQFESRREARALAVAPEELTFPRSEVEATLEGAAIRIVELPTERGVVDFRGAATDVFHNQLPRFPREVETARARGDRLVIAAPEEHHPRVRDALEPYGVRFGGEGVSLIAGEFARGFRLPAAGVVLYTEDQLFPRRPAARRKSDRLGAFFSGLRDLRVGDFVVHSEHGIGQLVGLRSLDEGASDPALPPTLAGLDDNDETAVEVMEIAYSGGQVLLLPLSRLDQIQRYSGLEGVDPRLDRLGGTSWKKTQSRVRSSVRIMAKELLKLYAERQLAEAPAMEPDSDMLRQFEAAFEFEETEDQLVATAAIKEDLESQQPMDRLLCGDVGFGKTEVAMRAAFKVVDSGFQVAILAPTTILADQHLETFRARMAQFPVNVEMVSRFRTAAAVRAIAKEVSHQKVDMLVGTHRLLSKDIEFKKLGLVIIDEEQRFGVAQKERLKHLRRNVHVLAMSATPVPRTLQLSIAGVRDLSLIESPPKDRMAIETQILPFSKELIREAIEAELERNGQVYYVYNQVESIERMATTLRELIPGLRITVGHGQMDERELSQRMHAFTRGEHDVLVASTIIENGIDIPNVNTMLVHRADRFGLAQLYQLRGRVGRSHQLAYCYLLIPGDRVLPRDAHKRLSAIREFTELGAGFRIAARDLEIRGAGNLLGAEQSGHIADVGIETYLKLLEETIRELKGEEPVAAPSTAIDLPLDVAIPEDYVQDTNLRMGIYRRLGSGTAPSGEVLEELEDRFGTVPESVVRLAALADLKRLAEDLRVQSISVKRGQVVLRFRRDARVDVDALARFVSEQPAASFSPSGVLSLPPCDRSVWLSAAREGLEAIAGEGAQQ